LLENLEFVAANATTPTMRLTAEILRESFSPTWHRMPLLIAQLRQVWDVDGLTLSGGINDSLWWPYVLLVAGHHDLVRELAEKHVASDPLSLDAWQLRIKVEIHAGDFAATREILSRARESLGPDPRVREGELFVALLAGTRNEITDGLSDYVAPSFLAAVKGDYETALRIADESERQQQLEPSPPLAPVWLLGTYYEIGATDRVRAIVKRIDEAPGGSAMLLNLLAAAGNALFFDLEDTPRFAANLKQARIDPTTLRQRPRLSTLE
jgi:hypothetical protein